MIQSSPVSRRGAFLVHARDTTQAKAQRLESMGTLTHQEVGSWALRSSTKSGERHSRHCWPLHLDEHPNGDKVKLLSTHLRQYAEAEWISMVFYLPKHLIHKECHLLPIILLLLVGTSFLFVCLVLWAWVLFFWFFFFVVVVWFGFFLFVCFFVCF